MKVGSTCSFTSALLTIVISDWWSGHIDHFVSSLKYVSNTLTHLGLVLQDDHPVPLSTIPLTCPNLICLNMIDPHNVDLCSLPMTPWPNLLHLFIYRSEHSITHDQIIDIWKRFHHSSNFDFIHALIFNPQL